MKILLDARMYGLENAGIGRYLIYLIKELGKYDNKNRYVVLLRKKYFRSLKLPSNWKKVSADYSHYGFVEQIKLPGLIKRNRVDLVHFPNFSVPILFKGKYIVTIHDLTMHRQGRDASTLSFPIYILKRNVYKYVFRYAVRTSIKIIVPTKSVKRELVDYYQTPGEKIEVTYEGISKKFKANSANVGPVLKKYKLKANNYFIYVGNTYPHKNISRAIEALVRLNEDREEKVTLAIASSRDVFTKKLEKEIGKYSAEKYVRTLGFVEDEDLIVLLKKSIAFIYPSLSEGFGLQGLEAISSGTIVIASDIPVFKEVYKDAAIYFNPFDFASIEKAMKEVLQIKPKERVELIEKGQKFIKRYSWSKMAKQTLNLYENSLSL